MSVQVRFGVNSVSSGDAAGQTVEEVREQFSSALHIPADSQVRINGASANNNAILMEGDSLEFVQGQAKNG
mgnify:CR=1 FL=1